MVSLFSLFFKRGSQQNWERYRNFPYAPFPHCHHRPPVVPLKGLMNLHWHTIITQSPHVYTRVLSWYCSFYGFGQIYDDIYLPLWYFIIQSIVTALKNPSAPPTYFSLSLSNPWQPLIISLLCPQVLPFPACHIVRIIQLASLVAPRHLF